MVRKFLPVFLALFYGCANTGSVAQAIPENAFPTPVRTKSRLTLTACKGEQQSARINDRQEDFAYVCRPQTMSSEDTAFVLIDMWDYEHRRTSPKWRRAAALLEAMRKNNFFVIHSPAEIALEYEMYQRLRSEVKTFLGHDYCKRIRDFGSANRQKIYNYGHSLEGNCLGDTPLPYPPHKILKSMEPNNSRKKEFIVFNDDDVRYLLWKHKIKNLIYIGGAVDQCLLRRPIGLNSLAGTFENALDLNFYLVEDFLSYMPNLTENLTYQEKNEALLKSLSFETAKITSGKSFEFNDY